jgi:hypothetical protein
MLPDSQLVQMCPITFVDFVNTALGYMHKANSKTTSASTALALQNITVNVTFFHDDSKLLLIFFPIALKGAGYSKAVRFGMFKNLFVIVKGALKGVARVAGPNGFIVKRDSRRGRSGS